MSEREGVEDLDRSEGPVQRLGKQSHVMGRWLVGLGGMEQVEFATGEMVQRRAGDDEHGSARTRLLQDLALVRWTHGRLGHEDMHVGPRVPERESRGLPRSIGQGRLEGGSGTRADQVKPQHGMSLGDAAYASPMSLIQVGAGPSVAP